MANSPRSTGGRHVVVVGAGGNIGSHAVAHLARCDAVGRVTLIDCDTYEHRNLAGQDITPRDIAKPKARVQACRLRRIRPGLRVDAVWANVEDVPLGWLRGDVILACLDSRAARRYVNEAARHLGVHWIDAGVMADAWLVRVDVYGPTPDEPCLLCSWDDRDYAAQEVEYPCLPGSARAAPTNAPSSLGALAAAIQVIECHKLLDGQAGHALTGRQVLLDAAHHKHYVSALPRNPACRFNHQVWQVRGTGPGGAELTVGEALGLLDGDLAAEEPVVLRLEGDALVQRLTCTGCGHARSLLRFHRRLTARQRACAKCGGDMVAAGFDMVGEADPAHLPGQALRRKLKSLGLRDGDIFTLASSRGEAHFQIGAPRQQERRTEQ